MSSKRIVIYGWSQSVHIQRWAYSLRDRGYDIKVISHGGEKLSGIETVNLFGDNKLSYLWNAKKAVKEAYDFKPDLIHVHYVGGFGIWGAASNFHPLVSSVWGADVIDLPKKFYYRKFINRILEYSDYITATSDFLKIQTEQLNPIVRNKIKVVPFGVEIPEQKETNFDDDKIKICFIKGHRPKYGLDILLKALAAVKEVRSDFHLNVAGSGEHTDEYKNLSKELGLDDQVKFVGFVPNKKITEFIQNHHMMVMPSTMDSESFGVAVLEVSAAGLPVIASAVGGVPEVLANGKTGILVEPNNIDKLKEAILYLLDNRDKMKEMGKAGYHFIKENYSWEKSLDLMSSIYDRLIDE